MDKTQVQVLDSKVFSDNRGYFFESYNQNVMDAAGIYVDFVQDNLSYSVRNVVRGLHYQTDHPQGKLVRVIQGKILDVAVDMRSGKWISVALTEDNKKMLWIPAGFAHGFRVFSETAHVLYKTTDFYHPESERTVLWNDAELGIDWGPWEGNAIVSEKDQKGLSFGECK